MILQSVVTAEFFGRKSLGLVLASVLLFGMIGGSIGPIVAGYIFDATGGYRLAFLISMALCAVAVLLSLVLLRSRNRIQTVKDDVPITRGGEYV